MIRPALFICWIQPATGFGESLRLCAGVAPTSFVVEIGGAHVDARTMVPPGYHPDAKDPTPKQISGLMPTALCVRAADPDYTADLRKVARPFAEALQA